MMNVIKRNHFFRSMFLAAIAIKSLFIYVGYTAPVDLQKWVTINLSVKQGVINFAPEVWLSLLALVFGTLIIVISIASEKTPKLIDLFVSDSRSRIYIWLITLSSLEAVVLQLIEAPESFTLANAIFFNCFIFLPLMIVLAIPYTFYILKYTRISDVIRKIYSENTQAIKNSLKIKNYADKLHVHSALFETVNQLHDLLQYIQFKEPKGEIIDYLGKSVRHYLIIKTCLPNWFFKFDESIRQDISFKTLQAKFNQLESEKTFYEQKVLRVLDKSYLLLIKEGHSDLASLCGSELYEIGRKAAELNDIYVVDSVVHHFNTFLRHAINQGFRSREIRNAYNILFHYSRLINFFVVKYDTERVVQCARFLGVYGGEAHRLITWEPFFAVLVETFASELKKIQITLYNHNFSRDNQQYVLAIFNNLCSKNVEKGRADTRLMQINLILFFLSQGEQQFSEITLQSLMENDYYKRENSTELFKSDCNRIAGETEVFWEETDQGNVNMFYSEHKNYLNDLYTAFLRKAKVLQTS
jgi:hypothetical protein